MSYQICERNGEWLVSYSIGAKTYYASAQSIDTAKKNLESLLMDYGLACIGASLRLHLEEPETFDAESAEKLAQIQASKTSGDGRR